MAFSDTVLIFLMTTAIVPTIVGLGILAWFLFRISTINKYLRDIRDILRQKESKP